MKPGKLHLIPEWKRVLGKAWSVRLSLLSTVLGGVAAALPVFADQVPPMWFLVLCMVVPLAAAVARLVDQPKLRNGDEQ